ncbi:MAG: aminotransferase class I/II-fold pyridoxal phosphate-dependent enzyme [Desulfarculaceae bacterium]|nr:aminotransferase class I/II-fold pyridoxal phosphate-dependent enzyme [Desulfarculaceae bacterium]MCF8046313.1 aminotransferase class I/II-fold pyridoxal phosphate-dependent enzyme [Desulfarculaceae bacterium]MCF8097894.1 aminotransferase class I/II-fold pyridoxal phosphate-dependent enzyme [Desulfarculaceae bacterium]MCF8121619.1 aminotransferase class I/II-fold pyridoxal phosphate-dependent enzyme [Desulfarculaceae bacterium]
MIDNDLEKKQERALAVFGGDAVHGGDIWGWSRRLQKPVSDILDLSASLNPLGPPPGLDQAVAQAMSGVCHYPDRVAYAFREAMADNLGVSASCLLPGNGSTALIRMIARALELKNLVLMAPAFGEMARSMAIAGRHFHYLLTNEQDGFMPTPHDLEKLWEMEPSAVIFSNPTTPAGTLIPRDILDSIIQQAIRRRTWVVVDEAFIDFADDDARSWACEAIKRHKRLLVLRSLTKFYCIAGLRLGFAMADAETLSDFAPLGQPWSVNTLAQAAGVFCLGQQEYALQTRQAVGRWREEQAAALSKMGLNPMPGAANYLLCRLPGDGPTATQVAAFTARQGVLVRPAASFVGCGEHHLRVAVTTSEEQQRLTSALRQALEQKPA